MTEQTDPLADVLAASLREHQPTTGMSVASGVTCRCGYWNGDERPGVTRPAGYSGLQWHQAQEQAAAVVRAPGAGLGGTTREQIAQEVNRVAGHLLDPAYCRMVADAVLALRPDPAPDDTTDLRAEVEAVRRLVDSVAAEAIRRERDLIRAKDIDIDDVRDALDAVTAERDAARADLARAREEAQLRADVWRDRYVRAEAETEAIAGDLAALREVLTGKVRHVYAGLCPDDTEGWDSRDPDCPACALLGGQE